MGDALRRRQCVVKPLAAVLQACGANFGLEESQWWPRRAAGVREVKSWANKRSGGPRKNYPSRGS